MILRLQLRVGLVPDRVVDALLHRLVVLEPDLRVSEDGGAHAAGLGAHGRAVAGTTERQSVL